MPTGDSSAKLESFFNCAAALMTLQLQDLALVSMQDFTDLIAQPPVSMVQLYSYTTLFIFNSFKVESDKITFTSRRTESKTLALLRLSV